MFKKSIISVLVVSMILSTMLIGCGSKETSNTKQEKPVNLTWYTIGTPQKDLDVVEGKLNEYLLEKINAKVDIKMLDWSEYNSKMKVKVSSGEKFDLMFTCSWSNNYVANVAKGALLPIDDLLEEYGKDIKDNIHPLFLEGAKVNGKTYAIPTNKELGQQAVWVVNKDLADKYNIDITKLTTIESLEPYLEIIKKNEPDVVPLALDKLNGPYIPNFDGLAVRTGIMFDEPTKVVSLLETDEAMKLFKTLHSYYNKGYIHQDAYINPVTDYIKSGKYFISKEHYQPYAEMIWENDKYKNSKIAIAPIHDPFANTGSTRGAMQGISITSTHPEKTMEFLNLLYTDKYIINLINYGIEGVHYEKLNDFHIKKTELGQEAYTFPAFSVGNLQNTYSFEGTPTDKWEKFKEFNDASEKAPSFGFTPDLSEVKTTLAQIKNVLSETMTPLLVGIVDPEEYLPKANDKLNKAGIKDLIAEIQKQYDEYSASKK
jgi:putative aldouronate transport system substrate-binding protein